jgi:NADH-quinone oxidoreductase subunit C
MEPTEIAGLLRKERFPLEVKEIAEFRGQVSVTVRRERIVEILRVLHDAPELSFDYLEDLCGVDYLGKKEPRFEVVYHLYSMEHRKRIRIKAEVPEDDCTIDSVVDIWED